MIVLLYVCNALLPSPGLKLQVKRKATGREQKNQLQYTRC